MSVEERIAYHCGPALAGIKPANIVSFDRAEYSELHAELDNLNRRLNGCGLYFETLCECGSTALVMAYRRDRLVKCLTDANVRRFLTECGYPKDFSPEKYIGILKRRIRLQRSASCEFPHEIGAFLGYPLHDIYGFIRHRGEGCICTGEWKVYAHADEAKRSFETFRRCRRAILKRVSSGGSLAEMFSVKRRNNAVKTA